MAAKHQVPIATKVVDSEMARPSGLKLGGLVEGMCLNVLTKEFFRSVNGWAKWPPNIRSLLPPK